MKAADKLEKPTPRADALALILDKLVPIFRDNAGSFSTDLARDVAAMVAFQEQGHAVCYWSCYSSGTTIRRPASTRVGHKVPTKLDMRNRRGDDWSLWFDAGNDRPIDVYEIDLVFGRVTKLKHITRETFYDEVSHA